MLRNGCDSGRTLCLTRDTALQAKPPPHASMRAINGLAVHQWAASNNAFYAEGLARLDRIVGDAALAERAVKPHLAYAPVPALLYQLCRDIRVRCNNDAVERARNGTKIRIAPSTFDLGCVWVHWEHLVSRTS